LQDGTIVVLAMGNLPTKVKVGCTHNPTSQKGHQIAEKNSQNQINIYVLSFKAMAIMATYWFFIHMNIKEFK
jgi:hypothetical protein